MNEATRRELLAEIQAAQASGTLEPGQLEHLRWRLQQGASPTGASTIIQPRVVYVERGGSAIYKVAAAAVILLVALVMTGGIAAIYQKHQEQEAAKARLECVMAHGLADPYSDTC